MKRVLPLIYSLLETLKTPTRWILVFILLAISSASARVVAVPASGRALTTALRRAQSNDTLLLSPGTYMGEFLVPPSVTILPKEPHTVTLSGTGHGTVLTLTGNNTVADLKIVRGRIGVHTKGPNNQILRSFIMLNRQSGINSISYLPLIEDNIIARNGGSGVVLWDVGSGDGVIKNNTIAYNNNHGISVGGKSEIKIINNIIAYNERLTIRSEGLETAIEQSHNNYYYNLEVNLALPKGNFSFDPEFVDPIRNNFELRGTSAAHYEGYNGSAMGTRIFLETNN